MLGCAPMTALLTRPTRVRSQAVPNGTEAFLEQERATPALGPLRRPVRFSTITQSATLRTFIILYHNPSILRSPRYHPELPPPVNSRSFSIARVQTFDTYRHLHCCHHPPRLRYRLRRRSPHLQAAQYPRRPCSTWLDCVDTSSPPRSHDQEAGWPSRLLTPRVNSTDLEADVRAPQQVCV